MDLLKNERQDKMKNKKCFTVFSCCAILAASVAMSAVAYFADKDSAINKISVGKNDISIVEEFSTPDSIGSGDIIKKKPVVKVSGTNCYVRIFCEFSDSNVNYAKLDFNFTDWTEKQADGYYYYKHKLSDGDETKPLFTKVTIDDTATDSEINNFDIIIYSESAQAYDTYNHTEFTDYKTAWRFWEQRKGDNT